MHHEPDADLKHQFASLRREEEAQAPRFALPVAPIRRAVPFQKWAAAAVAVLAVAGTLWWLVPWQRDDAARLVDLSSTVLQLPTDFLLETPGRELLRTVPTFGAREGFSPPRDDLSPSDDSVSQTGGTT